VRSVSTNGGTALSTIFTGIIGGMYDLNAKNLAVFEILSLKVAAKEEET
jgi:hypothetical protein